MTDNNAASKTIFSSLNVQEFICTKARIGVWRSVTIEIMVENYSMARAYGPWDRHHMRSVQHAVLRQIAIERVA